MELSKKRVIIVNIVIGVIIAALVGLAIWAQLFNRANAGNVSAYTVTVDAVRGEILDRNGLPLVSNRQGNSITFNASSFPSADEQDQRNEEIISLIQLCEANGIAYIDTLPITINEDGEYEFTEDEDSESYLTWLKSSDMLNLNDYATADNCMSALIKRYNLQAYSKEDALKIASVCAQMKKDYFSKSYPYTFAEDVPTELITIIMENKDFYQGVENTIVAYREYEDGTLAPHILGRVSGITAETYEKKAAETAEEVKNAKTSEEAEQIQRDGYTVTDTYGSSGIELAMEKYLRGSRGVKTVTTDTNGNTTETYTVEPEQGNAVIMTLDRGLQEVAQKSLENRVKTLNVSSQLQCAGAVVVENVNTGEILACATYPTYDNNEWSEKYSEWAEDSNSPLWNRATMSVYEPGSTFKPLVAIAALEEGIIDADYKVYCNGSYTYYSDHTYYCAHYNAHGTNNVVDALDQSCNVFFYDVSRQLGISKMEQWAAAFGLGQKTGVEISEATGQMSSPEERQAAGGVWYPGDTITAGIGQCDDQFTLLQLCNYVATIANGGTRYVPHFIKEVKSADYSETILKKDPEVAQKISISETTLNLVKAGMLKVGTTGFCQSAFADLPITVAAKTGTSEVSKVIDGKYIEGNNGFLISFGPYENPEIAVAVVIETADAGSLTAVVAADIYDYYFSTKEIQTAQAYNTLLS